MEKQTAMAVTLTSEHDPPRSGRPVILQRYHFSGVGGAGMSPLAQLLKARGHTVQGSDRAFDRGDNLEVSERLRALGITLGTHDGSALTAPIDRFVHSTAVEADTPEMVAARALGLELVPRPALLAEIVNAGRPGVAIAGTSGKSTVTGMIGWILREAGCVATVLGGAGLAGESGGLVLAGPADGPVVAETCESDGTLIGYRPALGLIHNISRDHAELPSLRAQFTTFARQCGRLLVNAGRAETATLGVAAHTYGVSPTAAAPLRVMSVGPERARGVLTLASGPVTLDLPQPGLHTLENAAAAAVVADALGVAPGTIAAALGRFPGLARRFEIVGTTDRGIRVIDDFAHNADKIRAAVTTAQTGCDRLIAVFQPHGYGPARFLRPELRALLPALLRPRDRFCYAEVFYAGGTTTREVGSRMLAADLPAELACGYAADHAAVVDWVAAEARPGDTVLLMGARDPTLPRLARAVFRRLQARPARGSAPA
jgi:UDP-N-acetylmuramate--alanine ligase